MTQLPLSLALRDAPSFANYLAGPNREVLQTLRDVCDSPAAGRDAVYLWGSSGVGKTHLLQATCHAFAGQGARSAYLPLRHASEMAPGLVENLEHLALVCIDDIDAIAGRADWETALFHLYNRMRDCGARLVMTARAPPSALGLKLADLNSRIAWGLVLQLHALNDDEKLDALTLRAQGLGIELPKDVTRFLLRRCPRDMAGLFEVLQRLDLASLAAQRRLTIPFVRELLEGS